MNRSKLLSLSVEHGRKYMTDRRPIPCGGINFLCKIKRMAKHDQLEGKDGFRHLQNLVRFEIQVNFLQKQWTRQASTARSHTGPRCSIWVGWLAADLDILFHICIYICRIIDQMQLHLNITTHLKQYGRRVKARSWLLRCKLFYLFLWSQ